MNKTRVTIISVWLLCLLLSLWVVTTKLQLITNIAQFMPQAKTAAEKLLVDELYQGTAARIILAAVEGGDAPELAAFNKRFAQQLRDSGHFVRVDNGAPSLRKLENTLLFQYRYLLSADITPTTFSPGSLKAAFQQRLRELASPLGMLNKQLLPADPINAFGGLLKSLVSKSSAQTMHGVWFSPDQRRTMLLLETRAQGYDLDAQITVIDNIQRSFEQLRGGKDYRLALTGPSVFATNSRHQIKGEVTSLSLFASAAVMLILWLAYRTPRLVLLSSLPLISAIVIAGALLHFIFGDIHGITMAFGITILGVAIDYPIHVFSHLSADKPVRQELLRIWPTLRLGIITTASGYMAMTATNFSGLAQLGVFAILGLLTAAIVTRWVLPCLLTQRYYAKPLLSFTVPYPALLNPPKVVRVTVVVIAVAALAYVLSQREQMWENSITALSPIPKVQLDFDRQMRKDIGAPEATTMILISAVDEQSVLEKTEALLPFLRQLRQAAAIRDFDAPVLYLPSIKTQQRRQALLPQTTQLEAVLEQSLQDLPFEQQQFRPFIEAVSANKTLTPMTIETLQGSELGLKLSSMLFEKQQQWTALIMLYGVNDSELISSQLQAQNFADVHYLNFKTATNRLISEFRQETLERIQWAGLFILIVLSLGLRSWPRLVSASLPVVFAITVDIALQLAWGEKLSLFNLVALLLVFGIGIDYGLFFSRAVENIQEKQRTFHALSVCAVSTVSVFGILSLSQVPVLKDIGITVCIGVLLSFLFSMVLAQPVQHRSKSNHNNS